MGKLDCICGSDEYQNVGVPTCIVTDSGTEVTSTRAQFGQCCDCGIIRQVNYPYTESENYLNFYRTEYPANKKTYTIKDYKHDYMLSKKRIGEYRLLGEERILDVGSGSGAFVDACRNLGCEAFGCEIGTYSYERFNEFIYRDRFEDVRFPTDHFDILTLHDTLEHVLDPKLMLDEAFRVVKQDGMCIVDFPNFFIDAGAHHWKDSEHVWCFNVDQLKALLTDAGFNVAKVRSPIESKLVFYCRKPKQKRVKILLPPGIGDAYWSLVKLRSFLDKNKLGIADAYITHPRDRIYNAHRRAFPFLEMYPFIRSTDVALTSGFKNYREIWREAYVDVGGRTIFNNVFGCNYFIAYNGAMSQGAPLEKFDPQYTCDWSPPPFISLEQRAFQKECEDKYGDYFVVYFVFQGTNGDVFRHFTMDDFIRWVNVVSEKTKCTPVFVGARWDADDDTLSKIIHKVPGGVSLISKTTVPQLFGLMRGSKAVIGIPSGITILSAAMEVKTVILWSDFFHPDFAWNSCRPSTRRTTYFAEIAKKVTADGLIARTLSLIDDTEFEPKPEYNRTALAVVNQRKLPSKRSHARQRGRRINITGNESKLGEKVVLEETPNVTFPLADDHPAVACVLKSGGDFNADYVKRLSNMLKRHVSVPYEFCCLTDMRLNLDDCRKIGLTNAHDRWWAKVELFRRGLFNTKRVIYFDLDVVILKNIDDLIRLDVDFAALRPWNRINRASGGFASGLMLWRNGSYSYIHDDFSNDLVKTFQRGDQEYMSEALREHKKTFTPLQDVVPGIHSYKRECAMQLPKNARIICFHGRPRPQELVKRVHWIRNNWL